MTDVSSSDDSPRPLSRRDFLNRSLKVGGGLIALGIVGAAAEAALQTDSASAAGTPALTVESYRQTGDNDSAVIARALQAAAAKRKASGAQSVTVTAAANRLYKVNPHGTLAVMNPSGNHGTHPVCVSIPPGVILDMQGSTLQLQGTGEAALVANTNLSGSGARDTDLGLRNAILDGRNVNFTSASLLQMAYVDRLQLTNVKIINGTYQGGWIFGCNNCALDLLDADSFSGQPWTIGSPLKTGTGHNQVYDSTLGRLSASNVKRQNGNSQPGNSFDMVLTRCVIESITATNCDGGIKLQWPSLNVRVGTVVTDRCGGTSGNSGLKLQGDPTNGPVTGVQVGSVRASNQSSYGLYMQYSVDCSVGTYVGVDNDASGTTSDVWIGGTNDHIGSVDSTGSGSNGVYVRPNATGYQVQSIKVRNPGRASAAKNKAAVYISGGSGTIDSVVAVDDQTPHSMTRGIDVTSGAAVGHLGSHTVTGQTQQPVSNVSPRFAVG